MTGMRVRLKSLKLTGFRSFANEQTVEFPDSGLVLVSGTNYDSKGGSGSGKSTILLGIAFAMGYCPFPASVLGTRGGKKPRVELVLGTDAGDVRIVRSTSPVQVFVDGEEVKGGAKAAEARLAEVVGAEASLLSLLCYRGQRTPGLFLSRTNAEKQELLLQAIPELAKFEKAIELLPIEIKTLESAFATAQAAFDQWSFSFQNLPVLVPGAQEQLAEESRQLVIDIDGLKGLAESLKKKHRESAQESETKKAEIAARYASQYDEAKRLVDSIVFVAPTLDQTELAKLREVHSSAKSRIESLQKERRTALRAYEEAVKTAQTKIGFFSKKAAKLDGFDRERLRIEKHLASIRGQICPTCLREWGDQSKDHENALVRELGSVNEEISACQTAAKDLEALHLEVAQLGSAPQPSPMVEKLVAASVNAETKIHTILVQQESVQEAAKERFQAARKAATEALQKISMAENAERLEAVSEGLKAQASLQTDIQLIEQNIWSKKHRQTEIAADLSRFAETAQQIERTADALAKATVKRDEALSALNQKKDFYAAIGREGFLGLIFDEILEEISSEANKILASIANTRNCTIAFQSQPITAKGAVKHSIVPVITVDGVEAPLEAGTSGGMQSAIELAVDLALGAVVMSREGIAPGWLVLDESFGGLGAVEMESCLEILQKYAQDRLVLVVEHMQEFKSMFTKVIQIGFKNGISFLE